MASRRDFIRNGDGPDLLLQFTVCAVATVLVVRFYLHLSGYPQIGGGGLHIAHMLWGGALMVVAHVFFLGFLGRRPQRFGAILGGIGFGLFIDELGKFVTHDNNYFFEPTIGLIYVIFVLFTIAVHTLTRSSIMTDIEYRVNALRAIEDAIVHGLTPRRSGRLRRYLSRGQPDDPIWLAIASLAHAVRESPHQRPSAFQRMQRAAREQYRDLVQWRGFDETLSVLFVMNALMLIGDAIARLGAFTGEVRLNFDTTGELVTALAVLGLTGLGMSRLRQSKLAAFSLFKAALLVALLTTQFFIFLAAQFTAVPGFAFNLLLLLALSSFIDNERSLREPEDRSPVDQLGERRQPVRN